MKKLFILFLSVLISIQLYATVLTPGETHDVFYNASSGEHNPSWSSDNPTLQVSYSGFSCHVTATAYFSGTAILTCKYKAKIGNNEYDRSKSWSFTCIDNQISINPSMINLNIGESKQLNVTFKYPTSITPKFYYTGYDSSLISISNNGMLTAKKVGHTTLYVTSNLGSNVIPVDINVNNESGSDVGETLNFIYSASDMTAKVSGLVDKNVKRITIPEKTYLFDDNYVNGEYRVIGIQNHAFTDSKLESIEIPPFINDIEHSVFFDCLYLKEVTLPYNLTEIPNSMFCGCKSLEHITLPDNITIIGYQAFSHSGLKEIQLTNNLKCISERAFGYCDSINEIEIPESVEVIETDAFWNCRNLKIIYFKGEDTNISTNSFYQCENINTIVCLSSNPPKLNINAFPAKIYNDAILYVPEESIEYYEQDDNWGKFKNIEASSLSDTGLKGITNNGNSELYVYSIDGVLMMQNCEIENLKYILPKGIYIIVCGKQRFKISI